MTRPCSTLSEQRRLDGYDKLRALAEPKDHRHGPLAYREPVKRSGILPEEAVSISLRMAREHTVERTDERVVVDPQSGDGEITREDASFHAENRDRIHDNTSV